MCTQNKHYTFHVNVGLLLNSAWCLCCGLFQTDDKDSSEAKDTRSDLAADEQKEADLLTQLSADEVKDIIKQVFTEAMEGLRVRR